ncbi:MAG TPA: TetR family transcriptional regulator [Ktedonobacteraceae bacterium]|nr:TetR family transcriptional regulator [Ktedonobacteraceae bacterium]
MTNHKIQRRAMRDEQKEERRQAIIDKAWRLFQDTSYESLTMAGVAEALQLAKGTVYLYFKTKEELFLTIEEQQLEAFFAEVDDGLSSISDTEGGAIPSVVELVGRALERRPGLTRLLAILHTILERNIDLETATQFKHMLKAHFERTGSLLEACLSFLEAGEGAHLLLQCHALVIGLWSLADPAPIIREVLQQPDLRMFEVRFAPEFSQALQALLYGLQLSSKEKIL